MVLSNASDNAQVEQGQKIPLSTALDPAVKVFLEGKSLYYSDMEIDPNCDDRDNSVCVRSWMGTPLQSGDEVIGVLSVSSAAPDLYDDTKLHVLEAFANHAAIAIINARLYEGSRQVAALEERNRLARDLHDSVTQTLFSASIIAEALPKQWEKDESGARANLVRLRQLTSGALAEMRMLLFELRPGSIQQNPLGKLVANLCEAFQAKNNIRVAVDVMDEGKYALPLDVKEAFYRIAQEILTNVTKHSKAGHVSVSLYQAQSGIALRIQDNGKGFDLQEIHPGHMGLEIMRERAAAIHAKIEVTSQPGKGTTITVEWAREE